MTNYQVFTAPPDGWETACLRSGATFGNRDWQKLLEKSFDCKTLYTWNGESGAAITAFRAGPFRIGYLGFPIGCQVGTGATRPDIVSSLTRSRHSIPLTCVRIAVSPFSDPESLPYASAKNPETSIVDLQNWNIREISNKLRRIRKAKRAGMTVNLIEESSVGKSIYELYASTIKRHGGSLRYNPRYFEMLIELSAVNEAVRVCAAVIDTELAGFLVTVRHEDVTYYMHGGTADQYRRLSPSDLLMASAIQQAQSAGGDSFNLMTSPRNQPSLVAYKEKWGAETRQQRTFSAPLSPAYKLFRVVEFLHRVMV